HVEVGRRRLHVVQHGLQHPRRQAGRRPRGERLPERGSRRDPGALQGIRHRWGQGRRRRELHGCQQRDDKRDLCAPGHHDHELDHNRDLRHHRHHDHDHHHHHGHDHDHHDHHHHHHHPAPHDHDHQHDDHSAADHLDHLHVDHHDHHAATDHDDDHSAADDH